MAYESNASKVQRYKANIMLLESKLVNIQTKYRLLESKIVKLELRDNQIINLLKMILNKATKTRKGKDLKIQDIIDWIDSSIKDYAKEEDHLTHILGNIADDESEELTEFGIDPE